MRSQHHVQSSHTSVEKGEQMTPATVTVAATKKAIEQLVEDLYAVAKGAIRTHITKWRTAARIGQLYKNLSSVRKVKTIWHTEDAIDLFKFYYPSTIESLDGKQLIRQISDFGESQTHLVIEGTVGQGKSIFLRFLCATELLIGKRIPAFIELRNLDDKTDILSYVRKTLDNYGFEADFKVFEFLASTGKLVLCLDGFDEIKDLYRQKIITDLESLALKYPMLRVLVTSRPDNGIDHSPFFRVVRLAQLRPSDVEGVIAKLTSDVDLTNSIIEAIGRSKATLNRLLTTPLMVTLLVIAYKADGKIPSTIAEFYESLFNTLFLRHDKLKPGYERTRLSGLSDRAFRDAFDALCFLARQKQENSFPINEMYSLSKKAIQVTQQSCDGQHFLADVRKITCLVLEEGGACHFIHKSVAEFHAASFVKNRPEEFVKKFLETLAGGRFGEWTQDLVFLEQIDRYRFCKYFLLPDAERISPAANDLAGEPTALFRKCFEACIEQLKNIRVGVDSAGKVRSAGFGGGSAQNSWLLRNIDDAIIDHLVKCDLRESREKYGIASLNDKESTPTLLYISCEKLVGEVPSQIKSDLFVLFRKLAKDIDKNVNDSLNYVRNKEQQESSVLLNLVT